MKGLRDLQSFDNTRYVRIHASTFSSCTCSSFNLHAFGFRGKEILGPMQHHRKSSSAHCNTKATAPVHASTFRPSGFKVGNSCASCNTRINHPGHTAYESNCICSRLNLQQLHLLTLQPSGFRLSAFGVGKSCAPCNTRINQLHLFTLQSSAFQVSGFGIRRSCAPCNTRIHQKHLLTLQP